MKKHDEIATTYYQTLPRTTPVIIATRATTPVIRANAVIKLSTFIVEECSTTSALRTSDVKLSLC